MSILRELDKIREEENIYKLDKLEMKLIEQWLDDPSFINWANQSDHVDVARWESYFNDHPNHWEIAKIGKEMALSITLLPINIDKEKAQQSLHSLLDRIDKLESSKAKSAHKNVHKSKRFAHQKWWSIAAAFTILIMFSGFSYLQFFKDTKVYITTGYGEQKEIQLPEGSLVTLNANSSLTYQTENPMDIYLVGEAFFEVEKVLEANEKFRVHTKDLVIAVLGTSFNVNARNDKTKVFLEEGIVELEIEEEGNDQIEEIIKMIPGDVVSYSKREHLVKEKRKDVSMLENTSWKEGALMFNNTKLIDALYSIEDIYGIQFVLESEQLRKEEITGGVPIKDLEVTLETLNEVYGIQVKSEGKRYFLSK